MSRIDYQHLKEWRQLNRVSTSQLAEIAGVDQSTLNRWIKTGKAVPGEVGMAWQKAFGWKPDLAWRLLYNGEMPVAKELIITPEEFKKLQALDAFVQALK